MGFAGGGLGILYAVTTISGPPLAVMLNNRASPNRSSGGAYIRLAESSFTAVIFVCRSLHGHSIPHPIHPASVMTACRWRWLIAT